MVRILLYTFLGWMCWAACLWASPRENAIPEDIDGEIVIEHPEPDPRGGKAFRLIYTVSVPVEIYWRFKTDFDNPVLLTNRYIEAHRVVERKEDKVVTEDRYAEVHDVVFRWETTLHPDRYTLDFILINAESCGQKFHHGNIRLEPLEGKTRVVHEAYFDFFGASFWVWYPWSGGMDSFLRYTARWERQTIARLKDRYAASEGNPSRQILHFTGTVRYIALEGGFFGILGDDGNRFDPVNLDPAFFLDGLAVRVQARISDGSPGFHMWGTRIEILDIEKLERRERLP